MKSGCPALHPFCILTALLFCFADPATADQRRVSACALNGKDMEGLYARITQTAMDVAANPQTAGAAAGAETSVPALVMLQTHVAWTHDEATDKDIPDIYARGFVRPGYGYYQFVPGLGIGLTLDKKDVIYVCINYGDREEEREVVLHIMEQVETQDGRAKFQRKLVRLGFRPVSSLSTLLDGFLARVPGLGPLYHKLHKEVIMKVTAATSRTIDRIMRKTLNYGAFELTIRAKTIDLVSEATAFSKLRQQGQLANFPHDSYWLWDNPPPEEERVYREPALGISPGAGGYGFLDDHGGSPGGGDEPANDNPQVKIISGGSPEVESWQTGPSPIHPANEQTLDRWNQDDPPPSQ